MNYRKILLYTALVSIVFGTMLVGVRIWLPAESPDTPAVEIDWNDLVPEGFTPNNPFVDMTQERIDRLLDGSEESNRELAELEALFAYAPTVSEFDGQRVRIAGYVVPLDFDGQTKLTEFLLVPYYGACIHTPPPPANQVVHANSWKPVEIGNNYDPVWAVGTLREQTVKSDLAESGYRLKIDEILPYSAHLSGADGA